MFSTVLLNNTSMLETSLLNHGVLGIFSLAMLYAVRYLFTEFKKMVEKNEEDCEEKYNKLEDRLDKQSELIYRLQAEEREKLLNIVSENTEILRRVKKSIEV